MNEQENLLAAETEEPEVPRKVGLPRFFELLGRDLWSFYRASFLCCLGFLPGFVLMAFGLLAGSLAGSAAGIPSNLVQAAFGIVVSTLLALALRKSGYVRKEFPSL